MEFFNSLNLTQIKGGTKLKQGDLGSVLSYSLTDENGQEITSFDNKTAYINLVLDDKIWFTTTTLVDISRVTFRIDKAIPIGLYYLEIKIDDYIFPSDRDSIILIEEGSTPYDLKELVPNYDINMTLKGILSDLSQKGVDITDLKTKMKAIYNNALADHAEIAQARGSFDALSNRLDNHVKQIQNLANGSPKGVYANLAALKAAKPNGDSGIYVTTDNGNWNYWDGSQWFAGGNYQSAIQPDPDYNETDYSVVSDVELWARLHNVYANNETIVNETGYPTFSKPNGEIGSTITGSGTQSWWTKRTIVVEQGEIYSAKIQQTANSLYYVYFLDESDTVVGRAVKNNGIAKAAERYYFSVPRGSKKMMILSFESGSVVWKGLSKNKLTEYTKIGLPGKFENGTSRYGQFLPLDRRVSTKAIQYCKTDTLIRVNKPDYVFFIDTFNENEEYIQTFHENVELVIPAGTYYRLTIQTVTDFEQVADVSTMYYAISYYQKSENDFNVINSLAYVRFDSNFKSQSKLYGIRKSDISKRYPAETIVDLGTEGLQSFAIDVANNVGYAFGWYNNASRAIKFDLSTKSEIERITKQDTGHDNDAVFVDGNVYIASADQRSDETASTFYKWNIQQNIVTAIDASDVIGKNTNGSRRIIGGICSAENNPENLYLVTVDHDYSLPFDGMHKTDDYLSIYYYDSAHNSGYLAWRMKWDEMYLQGATAVNDIMYIACNRQHTSSEGYKGIVIKVVDLVAQVQVDEIELIGDFEPESINHVYENGDLYLILGIAKYNSFSKVVKMKIS